MKEMVKKHILPLTYKPKIPDVISGKCTQTIRPISSIKSKKVGDLIMFHGWSGRPYRSEWSFRTPYWRIIYVLPIYFEGNSIFYNSDDKEFTVDHCKKTALLDGFDNYVNMYDEFYNMYGSKMFDITFEIIRWSPIPPNTKNGGV